MFKIGWFSCATENHYILKNVDAVAFFSQGDCPYMNNQSPPVDKDSTQAQFDGYYDDFWTAPALSVKPVYIMADDHEWGGDNWDHTITQANAQTGIGAVTQADVDNHWDAGNKARIAAVAKYGANTANTDSEAVAEAPSEANASAANYPVQYFRVGYDNAGNIDNVNPHIEFFVLDCISYRDPIADVDGGTVAVPSKTILGVNQRDWLKARLNSSVAVFKAVMSPKKLYKAGTDNSDTWGEYTKERDHILDDIKTNAITGVFWCTGDRHWPQLSSHKEPDDTYDNVCITACPIGVATNAFSPAAGIVWNHDSRVIGTLEIYDTYVIPRIIRATDGHALWTGRIDVGTNVLNNATQAVVI